MQGTEGIKCTEIPLDKTSDGGSRLSFRDIWSSSHSISWQMSLKSSALLSILSLSIYFFSDKVLKYWSIDKIMPCMDSQTISYEWYNSKWPNWPQRVQSLYVHLNLNLFLPKASLTLKFLKLNKWDHLFWGGKKRRNLTTHPPFLLKSYLLKAISRYLQCAEISYDIGSQSPCTCFPFLQSHDVMLEKLIF